MMASKLAIVLTMWLLSKCTANGESQACDVESPKSRQMEGDSQAIPFQDVETKNALDLQVMQLQDVHKAWSESSELQMLREKVEGLEQEISQLRLDKHLLEDNVTTPTVKAKAKAKGATTMTTPEIAKTAKEQMALNVSAQLPQKLNVTSAILPERSSRTTDASCTTFFSQYMLQPSFNSNCGAGMSVSDYTVEQAMVVYLTGQCYGFSDHFYTGCQHEDECPNTECTSAGSPWSAGDKSGIAVYGDDWHVWGYGKEFDPTSSGAEVKYYSAFSGCSGKGCSCPVQSWLEIDPDNLLQIRVSLQNGPWMYVSEVSDDRGIDDVPNDRQHIADGYETDNAYYIGNAQLKSLQFDTVELCFASSLQGLSPPATATSTPTATPTSSPTAAPTATPTSSPTAAPTPAPTVTAVGDPHLTNLRGERFDLLHPGIHMFLLIPQGASAQDTLLRVDADVSRRGSACADIYIQSLNVTGKWADEKHAGGFHFSAQNNDGQNHTTWMHFGQVDLNIVQGHTFEGSNYLNFFASNLGKTGYRVGGLLGEDDHTIASTASSSCKKSFSLLQLQAGKSWKESEGFPGDRSLAEATL